MGDQHDGRAVVNMAVIHDVDEQFVEALMLYPVVEDGDEVFQIDLGGILEEQLEVVLYAFHGLVFLLDYTGCRWPSRL